MRRWKTFSAITGLALGMGGIAAVAAPAASAASVRPATVYCFTSQGTNWGSASCQTSSSGSNGWQLVVHCTNQSNPAITTTVTGQWHSGAGTDTLYCPTGYYAAYEQINNLN
ncbi:hypothetical protein [Streptomyces sp. IBSBF 2435]|uniref:hypothetical protein n=1 Tax=Streptomyces sp. IBSBF 2435 TaxID=2903531 RepID=UPI002FDBCA7A